jgi:aryl-alcohol dehydrogenase-like predicted oxidoreductase
MKTRHLGRNGPKVSAIGLGCMGMSQSYGTPDRAESLATIHRALDLGIRFLDTADVYGPFTNEELVREAIRGRREEVFLATKCGLVSDAPGHPNGVDGSPGHIRSACEASLRRLGVPSIDLYYLHRVDPTVPIEDSVRAMASLVDEGKVRFLGLSEVGPQTLKRAHAVHPITAVQSEYSLWTRDPEDGVLPTCRELGIGFVPFSPLGRGFLSGGVRGIGGLPEGDFRRRLPRFQEENLGRNLELVDRLSALAAANHCTPAQLALAWLLAQGEEIVPIPGTKRRKYLEENAAAVDLRLSASDLQAIEEAIPKGAAHGDRYSAAQLTLVNQ